MNAKILELLLFHAEVDESSFRKAPSQLAAAESRARHVRGAEEIRGIFPTLSATVVRMQQVPVNDIAAARGELADILEGSLSPI